MNQALARPVAIAVMAIAPLIALEVDPALPAYQPAKDISGKLHSAGMDALNNLMTFWAEGFITLHPTVNITIEGTGGCLIPWVALTDGTAQLAPMSRPMRPTEIAFFENKWGYPPTAIVVAVDALAVFVHQDNPLPSLTLTQVDSIFSATCKRGGAPVATWGDLGLTGEWSAKPLSLHGRNSASGTYGFFKQLALANGDFKPTVAQLPGSSAVVKGVAGDPGSIGYSGAGYLTTGIRAVPISDGGPAVAPSHESAVDGSYPLKRHLYIYINAEAKNPLISEFIRFALSKPGQEIVAKDGYYPLSVTLAAAQLALLK